MRLLKPCSLFSLLLLLIIIGWAPADHWAAQLAAQDYRVAYLKNGEVWTANWDGQGKAQITTTASRVEDYLLSPRLNYMAYTKILKYVDEPGIFEDGEEVPKRSLCSIVIMDLKRRKILKEILPKENWIYLARWLPGDKLLCYESSGFDVAGFFKMDPITGKKEDVDPETADQVWSADYSEDGVRMLYVDDTGVGESFKMNLHSKDLISNSDTILLSRRTIYTPAWSKDRNQVAFLEVSQEGKKSQDTLWVFDTRNKQLSKCYTGPARSKSAGERCVAWSPDGQYVAMFLAPEAMICAAGNLKETHSIPGSEFAWLSGKKIVYRSGSDLFIYDLTTLKSSLFIRQAALPKLASPQ